MGIEIQKPELERRVLEGIRSGRFQDVDELLTKAIDALSASSGGRRAPSIGRSAPLWKAYPAKSVAPGCSATHGCRLPPYSRTLRTALRLTSWSICMPG